MARYSRNIYVIVDVADPAHPVEAGRWWVPGQHLAHLQLLSVFPRPHPPAGAPYRDFCDRAGWSGPHNQSQLHHNPDVAPQDRLVYLTYFNAGLRIYDVTEPRLPTEVAWFLPPDPTHRYGPQPPSELVVQSEDVLVDRRGFIYLTDKNQGLWVLQAEI